MAFILVSPSQLQGSKLYLPLDLHSAPEKVVGIQYSPDLQLSHNDYYLGTRVALTVLFNMSKNC